MNHLKKAGASTKKFVHDHRVAIAITLTTVICLTLNRVTLSAHDEFLTEHGLIDEFYTPTEEEIGA